MLIPIGSWCRTAYQVKEFLKTVGAKPIDYPYDWTITPYAALIKTLSKEFDPGDALGQSTLVLSKWGSILDNHTQLIHHHDFPPSVMSDLGKTGEINSNGVPSGLFETDLIRKAHVRLRYTFANLEALKSANKKLVFIRWNRTGHPDPQLPYAFEGESISALADTLSGYLENDNFSILKVTSKISQGEHPGGSLIIEYNREKYGVSATICERKELSDDFKGDTESWHNLLSKYVKEEGIDLS